MAVKDKLFDTLGEELFEVVQKLQIATVALLRERAQAWPGKADMVYTSDPARKVKMEQVTAERQAEVDALTRAYELGLMKLQYLIATEGKQK